MIVEEQVESPRFRIPANDLQSDMRWMDNAEEVPPIVAISTHATIWMFQIKAFRKQEGEALITGAYGKSLDEHRYAVAQMISVGERLLLAAKQNHIVKFLNGFSIEDLKSAIETLHITFSCQHGEKNSPQVNAEIEKLFSVA